MYDVRNDTWSDCPKRKQKGGDHSTFCLNDKLYIFISEMEGNRPRTDIPFHKTIERLDVKAHIQGQTVAWEQWVLPIEHFRLMFCPFIAPISETEIVCLSFGRDNIRPSYFSMWSYQGRREGGIVTYDVEKRTIKNVGKFGQFPTAFASEHTNSKMIRNGQVAGAVFDQQYEILVISYMKGDSKIRVYREDP